MNRRRDMGKEAFGAQSDECSRVHLAQRILQRVVASRAFSAEDSGRYGVFNKSSDTQG
jgi:hypothetical protein